MSEKNFQVWLVTADGLPTNIVAFQNLGCKMCGYTSVADMQAYFAHGPTNMPVYVTLDSCHMLKLARNVLADKKLLTSDKGNICWHHLQSLHELQNALGLKFANNISGSQINFKNKKMNVSIAVCTLCSSSAGALVFLMKTGNLLVLKPLLNTSE